ncbi:zinc-finger domain-containing protein [Virgibacillus halodenitrificans]|uniref:zinc-finger domain-containing protein n=1 Tax=Virgibacillus halodenitrificans TaxID=1482 RepID=UPI0013CEA57E|nr:zinc-finger domain-containing protein [Virgibacillus halodenitrificans]
MGLSIEEQKQLRQEATNMIDEVCGSCQLILENRKKLGNKAAYNYCVRECSVGKRLQKIGKELLEARDYIE